MCPTQEKALAKTRAEITRITAEQQESVNLLQRLSDAHTSLEPLLARLNALLSAEGKGLLNSDGHRG